MTEEQKLENAQVTCKGLQRLISRLNIAAVDLDQGGSIYELSSLLSAVNTCADNLGMQLNSLNNEHVQKSSGEVRHLQPTEKF